MLSITHEVYQCFGDELEVKNVFLDISKGRFSLGEMVGNFSVKIN